MINIKKQDVLNLLQKNKIQNINIKKLKYTEMKNEEDRTVMAYYIFGLSKISVENKLYQNLLQFFILTINDIINNKNHTDNETALKYAFNYFINNVDYNEKELDNFINKTNTTEVSYFFSTIEVLSDWVNDFSTIRIKQQLLPEVVESTWQKINSLVENQKLIPQLMETSTFFTSINSFIKNEDPVKVLIQDKSARDYFLSTFKEIPQIESVTFFCMVLENWGNARQQSLILKEKLLQTIHFLNSDNKINNVELVIYSNDLFKKHIPQLISYVELLKDVKDKNFDEQIEIITTYTEKINQIYLNEIQFKMKVYKKFLEEKLSKF